EIDHVLAGAAAGNSDIGLARFAGAVHDTAEHRERKRRLYVLESLLERVDRADYVETLASAAWARNDADATGAQAERLEDLEADAHFLLGFGRKGHADRVADAGPEQVAHSDARLDGPADQPTRFGNAQVER